MELFDAALLTRFARFDSTDLIESKLQASPSGATLPYAVPGKLLVRTDGILWTCTDPGQIPEVTLRWAEIESAKIAVTGRFNIFMAWRPRRLVLQVVTGDRFVEIQILNGDRARLAAVLETFLEVKR